jgi:hypothetical protein
MDRRLGHSGLKASRSLYNFADMASGFEPLSALDPESLVEYLGREGHAAEAVRWKYFDLRFNRNRERGYAWVKDGKIGGFLGLIPFLVVAQDRVIHAAWTCDWSVQDPSARGIGILLIRQAQNQYEFLTQLGGNEATQRIISRLSSMTVNDAGMVFHLPLRVGAALRVARRKLPRFPLDAVNFVNRLPLRFPRRPAGTDSVTFEPGVSQSLSSLLEPARHGGIYSRYDFEYLRWQVGDCPFLHSETCYVGDRSAPKAAALVWREKVSTDFWRLAVWSSAGAENDELEIVLSSVVRRVYEANGFLLSLVVSRLDHGLIDLLRSKKFVAAPRRRPLHIIVSKKTGEAVPELWPLSYLDTDYAYRF